MFMKTLLSVALFLASFGVHAQNSKLIAVMSISNSCAVTSSNLNRIEAEVKSQYSAQEVQWMVLDLSTEQSRQADLKILKENRLGLLDKNTKTGIISLYDATTKRPITQLQFTKTTPELIAAFQKALSLVKP